MSAVSDQAAALTAHIEDYAVRSQCDRHNAKARSCEYRNGAPCRCRTRVTLIESVMSDYRAAWADPRMDDSYGREVTA